MLGGIGIDCKTNNKEEKIMCNNKENAMNKVIDIVVDCCATDLGNGKRHVSIGTPLFICIVSA